MVKEPLTELEVQITGEDGNIFNLYGIVTTALKRNGYREYADKLSKELWDMESYESAIKNLQAYVHIM